MRGLICIPLLLCLAAPVSAQGKETTASSVPLTSQEIKRFKREVQACWLVKDGWPRITVGFSLDRNGRPVASSFRAVRHESAPKEAVAVAFAAAKRAVLRCGRDGFTLPVEKYAQWRDIELVFDPERTILR